MLPHVRSIKHYQFHNMKTLPLQMSIGFLMCFCVGAVVVLANAYQNQQVVGYRPQAFAVIAREHQQKTNILSRMYYGPTFGFDAAIALLTPTRVFLHMLMPPKTNSCLKRKRYILSRDGAPRVFLRAGC